jgi:hypothetical protein
VYRNKFTGQAVLRGKCVNVVQASLFSARLYKCTLLDVHSLFIQFPGLREKSRLPLQYLAVMLQSYLAG